MTQRQENTHPRSAAAPVPGTRRTARPVPPPEARSIALAGRSLPYTHRVSARARGIRLIIRPERGLEVVTPRGASLTRVEQVLREKSRWILTTLDRVEREAIAATPPPITSGLRLPLAGRQVTLAIAAGAPVGRFRAHLDGDTLRLTVATTDQPTLRLALETWYRRHARTVIAERLAACNARYSFTYGRVAIKEQKSRWGSCSRQGNLNFNWRLLLAPLPVLDYVVVHELCHLKELNHSPRFWQLVALACPEYTTQRAWLRKHGRELRF